jgi:hypothetical protein
MKKTGTATLPLHYGKAPRWLFSRMTALSREIIAALVTEFGAIEVLRRLSDPYWFQALGCILGFDWHSSGLTTTVTGALKEGLKDMEKELGIFITGGKGLRSRKTPDEIYHYAERYSFNPSPLIYASRMSAKVDNTALQDGYQLYHHVFILTLKGDWAVIQQGMNLTNRKARRYHWLGEDVNNFVVEPHKAICSEERHRILNMVALESDDARRISVALSKEGPDKVIKEAKKISSLVLPERHNVAMADINFKRLYKILTKTYDKQPQDFESLLGIEGIGPKTIRALSLISELIYDRPPSYCDPARFSFVHGGKDGTPFPVDRKTYDKTIEIMRKAIQSAGIGNTEKINTIKRMNKYFQAAL